MSELHDRLRKLLFLVPYVVRHRGVQLTELAQRLNLSEQQLLKEIDFLLMVGRPPFLPNDMIDIYHEGGKVYVDLHQSLEQPPCFTVFEALALACAAQIFLTDESANETTTAIRQALLKVVNSMPDEAKNIFEQLSSHYLILSAETQSPHLNVLRRAIDEFREVEVEYFTASRGEITHRSICPYGLHLYQGAWYLVAYCNQRKSVRIFRLSRIHTARLGDKKFRGNNELNIAEFVEHRLSLSYKGEREIVIHFSSNVARWIQERWGPQHITFQEDGSVLAKIHNVSDEYILAYVASFAGEAKFVSPQRLVDLFRNQIQRALEKYS